MNGIFCLSVHPSVRHTFLTMFPSSYHYEISGVITRDQGKVHAKGQGQRSKVKVKVTEVTTQLNRFRTVTPVWIHIWWWNNAYSLIMLRRGTLLFFKVIRQISRSHDWLITQPSIVSKQRYTFSIPVMTYCLLGTRPLHGQSNNENMWWYMALPGHDIIRYSVLCILFITAWRPGDPSVNWFITGDSLSPLWHEAITWTNADMLSLGPLGKKISKNWIIIQNVI